MQKVLSTIYQKIRMLDGIIANDLSSSFLQSDILKDICVYASIILFLTAVIKIFVEITKLKPSDSIRDIFTKELVSVLVICSLVCNPAIYQKLAGILLEIQSAFMQNYALSEIDSIRESLLDMYKSFFNLGEKGTSSFSGWSLILDSPVQFGISVLYFFLFIFSIYILIALPPVFICFALALCPLVVACYPILKEAISRYVMFLFACTIMVPVCMYATLMVTVNADIITLVENMVNDRNIQLITITTGVYSVLIAYTLPLAGYLTSVQYLKTLRIVFPITWIEFALSFLIASPFKIGKFLNEIKRLKDFNEKAKKMKKRKVSKKRKK